jgi:thiol-disulfide isomerase/thioredoxin
MITLILLAVLHKKKFRDVTLFQGLYLKDSVEVLTQIENEEKILMVFFHPECEICQAEVKVLDSIKAADITLDLISSAHSDSVAKFLKDFKFGGFKSVDVVVDSLLKWSLALDVNYIPTMIYFRNGEILKRRKGAVNIETFIDEKERN